jgi:hypothetical protein
VRLGVRYDTFTERVGGALALPPRARSLLDVAGGHGEFSMALCRRHAGLSATIVDLPGSARADTGSVLGLFFHLTSGADTYARKDVAAWLQASGFARVTARSLPQLPGLALLRAERAA